MEPLFLTGATGYVGRQLLDILKRRAVTEVRCLTRSAARLSQLVAPLPSWQYIEGTLDSLPSSALVGARTVVHLAAITGKARPALHHAVNQLATERLIEAARDAAVPRFLFVSSVAAAFTDIRHYPYAASKRAAEATVRQSGLDWAIVRPTMVFGPRSPVLAGLARLASAPVGVRFGPADQPVQPIAVTDLAGMLADLALSERLGGVVYGAGGPDVVPLAELLERIRIRLRGARGRWVALPLTLTREILALLEPLLFPVLPLTAGQLASFANEGTATTGGAVQLTGRTPLEQMLAESLDHG